MFYIDIMYINGMPLLTTISKNIKYHTTMWVADHTAPTITSLVESILKLYQWAGFQVMEVCTDMSPHICLIWLVLIYIPYPWSSRKYTCWAGIVLSSSLSQLRRSNRLCTSWKCTQCLRAIPGSVVGLCPNKLVRECSHTGDNLGISFSIVEVVFFLI